MNEATEKARRGPDRLWLRAVGGVLVAMGFFAIDTTSSHLLHQVLWPAAIVTGFYLVTQNPLATALITGALAMIHADSASPVFALRIIYPAAALLAVSICVVILTRRFRHRIQATHDARWSSRNHPDQTNQTNNHDQD